MTPQERSKEARKRYKRMCKRYRELSEQQPLATKNAIISAIAADEGVTTTTVIRAITFCAQ